MLIYELAASGGLETPLIPFQCWLPEWFLRNDFIRRKYERLEARSLLRSDNERVQNEQTKTRIVNATYKKPDYIVVFDSILQIQIIAWTNICKANLVKNL